MAAVTCRLCGQAVEVAELPPDTMQRVGSQMSHYLHGIRDSLLCDACRVAHDPATRPRTAQERDQAVRVSVSVAQGMGDLPGTSLVDFLKFRFPRSEPLFEAQNQPAWDAARAWKRQDGTLWLWGESGSGKSHAALAILCRAVARGLSCAFIGPDKIEAALHRQDIAALERWTSVEVLVLDDVDKMKASDYYLSSLWSVVNGRALCSLPTIVTANMVPDAVLDIWDKKANNLTTGTAIMDRLTPCRVVEMGGASLRGGVTYQERIEP